MAHEIMCNTVYLKYALEQFVPPCYVLTGHLPDLGWRALNVT